MRKERGFTLVELLVVIAIITILASIVVPRVTDWLARARMAKAVSEIRNMDLAVTSLMSDAGCNSIAQLFDWNHSVWTGPNGPGPATFLAAIGVDGLGSATVAYANYNIIMYELLRRGKDANFGTYAGPLANNSVKLKPAIVKKLRTGYMDVGNDPWQNSYQFFLGPWPKYNYTPNAGATNLNLRFARPIAFRCYRTNDDGSDMRYDWNALAALNAKMPGNPYPDNCLGLPAQFSTTVYIYSMGANMICDQNLTLDTNSTANGYDDINNWDNGQGWTEFY